MSYITEAKEAAKNALALDPDIKEFNAFSYRGVMYRGFAWEAVCSYVECDNKPADFLTYLQQHYRVLVFNQQP